MNFPIIFMVAGVILVIWGIFRLTHGGAEIKRAFMVGWRGYKGKDKEQKK